MMAICHSCTFAGACIIPPNRPRTAVSRSLLARMASSLCHDVVAMHSPERRSTIIDSPTKPSTCSSVAIPSVRT